MQSSQGESSTSITQSRSDEHPKYSPPADATSTHQTALNGKASDGREATGKDEEKVPSVASSQKAVGGSRRWRKRLKDRWEDTLTHDDSTIPLAWQALLTGLVDALTYGKAMIWTGFQTGNMVQFSQTIAQFMLPNSPKYPLLTLLRALSVLSFLLGGFLGAKAGAYFGDNKRSWLVTSSVIQSVFLFGAAAILLTRPEKEAVTFRFWPGVIIMTAISMGMQSISAQKLASPAFATTVAFTATLSQIASDPYLFAFRFAPVDKYRQYQLHSKNHGDDIEPSQPIEPAKKPVTMGRDKRLLAIVSLCIGAGVAECMLYSQLGIRGSFIVAASFKLVQAILWFVATSK